MYIAVVAGESSGDRLAAGVMRAVREQIPQARFVGVGGNEMRALGLDSLFDMSEISFVGLDGLVRHVWRILSIRRRLYRYFLNDPPDLFIGVDVPDFNLSLERRLKKAGIPTMHYVAPTVWAWRHYRISKIRKAVQSLLVLYPFEQLYFQKYGIASHFVGHPAATQLPERPDTGLYLELGLDPEREIVALLPGSRASEIHRLAPIFVEVAQRLRTQRTGIQFVVPFVNRRMQALFREEIGHGIPGLNLIEILGRSMEVLSVADVAVVASGTAALEAALLERPLVVAYKVSWPTYLMVKCVSRLQYVSMPNFLIGKPVVAEFLQQKAKASAIGQEVIELLDNERKRMSLLSYLREIRPALSRDTNREIADLVCQYRGSMSDGSMPGRC